MTGLFVQLADPEGPPPLVAAVDVKLEGEAIRLPVPLVYTWTDRVHGERERRVLVVPPATITPAREAVLFPNLHKNRVTLRVHAGTDGFSGQVLLELPQGWRSEPAQQPVSLAQVGDEAVLDFQVVPPAAISGRAAQFATPLVEVAGKRWSFRQDVIDYPHVPLQTLLQPARLRLVPLKLSAPRGPIGYVEGPGDTVAADLAHIGAHVEMLSDAELAQGDLSRFAAIVLGVRAHNTRDVLRTAHPRLMRYVEQGGTLIVQYVTRSNISPLDQPVGPYPLAVGRGRVTDEDAAMHALDPANAVLHAPHKLQPDDFAGWVQERGLYFAETWDPKYKPVFELADPGEPAQRGALLIANYGKGRYVYTGLAFFRQLPAGVPGAYRLFVNLLARPEPQP